VQLPLDQQGDGILREVAALLTWLEAENPGAPVRDIEGEAARQILEVLEAAGWGGTGREMPALPGIRVRDGGRLGDCPLVSPLRVGAGHRPQGNGGGRGDIAGRGRGAAAAPVGSVLHGIPVGGLGAAGAVRRDIREGAYGEKLDFVYAGLGAKGVEVYVRRCGCRVLRWRMKLEDMTAESLEARTCEGQDPAAPGSRPAVAPRSGKSGRKTGQWSDDRSNRRGPVEKLAGAVWRAYGQAGERIHSCASHQASWRSTWSAVTGAPGWCRPRPGTW
jgi:hypothetical protein